MNERVLPASPALRAPFGYRAHKVEGRGSDYFRITTRCGLAVGLGWWLDYTEVEDGGWCLRCEQIERLTHESP